MRESNLLEVAVVDELLINARTIVVKINKLSNYLNPLMF